MAVATPSPAHMLANVSMSIVYLARHGPSASAPRGWLSAAEFRRYLHGYERPA